MHRLRVLAGLLATSTDIRVTSVNAPMIARERGLKLTETRSPDAGRFASLVTLRGPGGGGSHEGGSHEGGTVVSGTVAGSDPRLVRLDRFWVDMAPAPWMLVTRHRDVPGTMGRIGLMLGEADVNISAMHLGRSEPRGDALMVLALDDEVPAEVADRIRSYEAVLDLWLIHLP